MLCLMHQITLCNGLESVCNGIGDMLAVRELSIPNSGLAALLKVENGQNQKSKTR